MTLTLQRLTLVALNDGEAVHPVAAAGRSPSSRTRTATCKARFARLLEEHAPSTRAATEKAWRPREGEGYARRDLNVRAHLSRSGRDAAREGARRSRAGECSSAIWRRCGQARMSGLTRTPSMNVAPQTGETGARRRPRTGDGADSASCTNAQRGGDASGRVLGVSRAAPKPAGRSGRTGSSGPCARDLGTSSARRPSPRAGRPRASRPRDVKPKLSVPKKGESPATGYKDWVDPGISKRGARLWLTARREGDGDRRGEGHKGIYQHAIMRGYVRAPVAGHREHLVPRAERDVNARSIRSSPRETRFASSGRGHAAACIVKYLARFPCDDAGPHPKDERG